MFYTLVVVASALLTAPVPAFNEKSCGINLATNHTFCNCSGINSPSFYHEFAASGSMLCVKHPSKIFKNFCVCFSASEYEDDDVFYNDESLLLFDDLSSLLLD